MTTAESKPGRSPRPVVISLSRLLPGPPDVVWRLITDWDHQDDWMLELERFVLVGSQREGVGVEAEATVRIGGIRTSDRGRVSVWEPQRRLRIDHLGWVRGLGELRLTPVGRATWVEWDEILVPPLGLLGAVGLRVWKPMLRRIFRQDLRVLAGLVRVASR